MRKHPGGDSGDPGATRLTRRQALMYGVGGAAAMYSLDKLAGLGGPSASAQGTTAAHFAPFQVDVPMLPVLEPDSTSGGVDRYSITMQEGQAQILHDYDPTPIWGYNGQFPGPTIRAREGRPVEVRQRNELAEEMTVHLHGGLVEEESDGALLDYHIEPEGERTYYYPNDQHAATLWYHDHVHGLTGKHLNAGLTAFYVIGSEFEERKGLPQDEFDVPLMIQDRGFLDDGSFDAGESLLPGFHGDTILVNGAIAPRMRVKRRLYRLRFLNASNAREYRLVLGNRRVMHQIAGDGGLLDEPSKRRALPLAAAERADVLIDFSQFRPGSELILRNVGPRATPSTTAVMRFDVEGGGGTEEYRIPKRLAWQEAIPAPRRTRRLTLEFQDQPSAEMWLVCQASSAAELSDEAQSLWTINGKPFADDRVDERPRLYTTEDWRWVNNSPHPHPMHLHGCHFRVLEVNGEQPHPADRGWKDTVNVPPNGSAVVRPYFKTFAGRFVFHCHMAAHSDQSMMGLMEIRES